MLKIAIIDIFYCWSKNIKTIREPLAIDYTLLVVLSAIWGSAFVSIEFALNSFPPFVIAFGRISLAALFLIIIIKIKNLSFPNDFKTWSFLILIGLLNNAMPFYLISWGQQYISASTASVMLAIGPFIALIVSRYVTQDEDITFFKLVGVFLGFSGVFVLLGDDFMNGNENSLYGKLALLIAVCGYIASGFLIRKISYVNTIVCSGSMFITATLMMLPFVFFVDFKGIDFISYSFLAIIYLAVVPTAGASLVRIKLVQTVGVQFMSQVAYLIPMFAILWSWVFFDEVPNKIILLALGLIFLGLFIRKIRLNKNKKD